MADRAGVVNGAGLHPGNLRLLLQDRLVRSLGKDPETATPRDVYDALSLAVREELTARWLATQRRVSRARIKRVCYLSVEYLPGRSLINALSNLGGDLVKEAREAVRELGLDLDALAALEQDPGLGNGGLGRLAACFLDSLATQQYAAVGYGIRYDYGIFTQEIDGQGGQRELASSWLRFRNVWEIPRSDARYLVRFGGRCETTQAADGRRTHRWVDTEEILAIGFDRLVPGNRSPTVNHLRLWSGRAVTPFHIQAFNRGEYLTAVEDQVRAKNLSRVLYPDDSTPQGKELRLRQQYFFVSASLQDLLAGHLQEGRPLDELPEAVAIQLNDTHPTLAIPEMMRLLVDEHGLEWTHAWGITRKLFGYTNHTLMSEALETWPVALFERLLPRHLQIIYLINREHLDAVAALQPGNVDLLRQVSIIAEDEGRRVRMSHLAIVGSHKVNGVARLHSDLMKRTIFAPFASLEPEKFINVTNGIAVRRWLKQSNPELSGVLSEHLGSSWENDLEELERLRWAADDASFRQRFRSIKYGNKLRLIPEIERRTGVRCDPESMFDVQVKRIHEYKRQLLNLLGVIVRYNRIRENPGAGWVPRTVIFAGKAAPGYRMAKSIIRLINNVATVINADPVIGDRLKVVFLPDYDVSLAQLIMPAADLSEQISTAGTEASGTGNMKLALNGALTIGTLDGANIEILEHVGADNIFIFGLTTEQVIATQAAGYVPREYLRSQPELAAAVEMIESGYFTEGRLDDAQAVIDRLLGAGEPYLVVADLPAYLEAQALADSRFAQQDDWSRRALLNTVGMGVFSSDRSIGEYAERIWGIQPVI